MRKSSDVDVQARMDVAAAAVARRKAMKRNESFIIIVFLSFVLRNSKKVNQNNLKIVK